MKRFPLSYLAERLRSGGELEPAPAWLVREPSPWQVPERTDGLTEPVLPNLALMAGGDALCFALEPAPGEGHLTLGRDATNDIALPDATLSGIHLAFHLGRDGSWHVQDAGSSNGSTLDGRPLEAPRLNLLADGASLQAGGVRLTFHDPAGFRARLQTPPAPRPTGPEMFTARLR